MTIFDLLFIVLFLTAIGTLIVAGVKALRGHRPRALSTLRRLAICTVAYVGIVYLATAFSKQVVLRVGEPQCFDEWCIAVDGVKSISKNAITRYDITLRISSRARRRAQRENRAKDVYLVDGDWKRYDPILNGTEVPLNTLLQPGQSVATGRTFELPADKHAVGLMVERSGVLPVCVIIGDCDAFHKGTVVRIE